MADFLINAAGVAKVYDLGAREAEHRTLREAITGLFSAPVDRFRRLSGRGGDTEKHWALADVSFDVKAGEALGVIGRNGAGKSTLLKILSRITEPTRGRIEIRGRVASLLEVGTGFHSELTGRENIFLNGAILGMSRAEIARKFDDIVAFAEVERFLDTPVKRYSSGMYMRLAFAVAANLDPEILLVDEVLAVGDIDFQKKCIDRMKGMAGRHTTVVFVSHNMSAIQSLCNRCLLLDRGRAVTVGATAEVVRKYMEGHAPAQTFARNAPPGERPCVVKADIDLLPGPDGRPSQKLLVDMTIHSPTATRVGVWLRIKDQLGAPVAIAEVGTCNPDDALALVPGNTQFACEVATEALALGDYVLSITTIMPGIQILDDADDCLRFTIERPPVNGATRAIAQDWGYGSVNLLATRVRADVMP